MEPTHRLIDYYLPPGEGFVLESLVATTYQVDFEFLEEELLAAALGVRSPVSRLKAFRSELERRLQKAEVSVLYDLGGCERLARLSPRIDAIPVVTRKLHSKISLLMWVREGRVAGLPPDRRIRLIVGSANLTRQGFRHNYECVASADFGGRSTSPRSLLTKAIGLVRQIGAESLAPQLARQLAAFEGHATVLAEGTAAPDDPVALVAAEEVVPTIGDTWAAMSDKPPEKVIVVSPFWAEGSTASEALSGLFRQLGDPASVEMVCRGERSGDGKRWLPVFDASVAVALKKALAGRVFLRATNPGCGASDRDLLRNRRRVGGEGTRVPAGDAPRQRDGSAAIIARQDDSAGRAGRKCSLCGLFQLHAPRSRPRRADELRSGVRLPPYPAPTQADHRVVELCRPAIRSSRRRRASNRPTPSHRRRSSFQLFFPKSPPREPASSFDFARSPPAISFS